METATPAAELDTTVTLDLRSLTLGEMSEIEQVSGRSFDRLISGSAGRKLVAVYVQALRSSGPTPLWSEVCALRLFDS